MADIRAALERKWRTGAILREALEPGGLFPLRIPIRGPGPSEISDRFSNVRDWIKQFMGIEEKECVRIGWAAINHRLLGQNEIPAAACFDSIADGIKYLKQRKDLELFLRLSGLILEKLPQLRSWVLKNPFAILDLAPVLPRLIRVAQWMVLHPKPAIYLRQIALEDIDTKFVEAYRKTLSEWFDLILDASQVDMTHTGARGFQRRYGFLSKPALVRFRILDRDLLINGLSDLTVRADEFRTMAFDIDTVFVTENDTNGLVFPEVRRAIVVFGRGYGFESLAGADVLRTKSVRYWGDIDTHGFAILCQFRSYFPHAESLLMDRDTLLAHQNLWVREISPSNANAENLTPDELSLFDDLKGNRLGNCVRLEQESIDYEWWRRRLGDLGYL